MTLAAPGFRRGARFIYEYDLNIPWRHEVRIEDRLEPEARKTYPVCIGGDGACPPEDCGGPECFMVRRDGWYSLDGLEDLDTMVAVLQQVAQKDGAAVLALDQETRWRLEDAVERSKARDRALEEARFLLDAEPVDATAVFRCGPQAGALPGGFGDGLALGVVDALAHEDGGAMRVRVLPQITDDDGIAGAAEEVAAFEKATDHPENLGLSVAEGKPASSMAARPNGPDCPSLKAGLGLPKPRHAPPPAPANPTPDTDIPAAAPARMPQSARLTARPTGSGRQQSR